MEGRPDPDKLLKRIQAEESRRGKLKLFFGANAGVGKTYAMLEAARQRRKEGMDVVVGIVETHGRAETAALLDGLEVLPRRKADYKGVVLQEFDLDAALSRRPQLILVDELAHSNAPGSRHPKRWQDVQELLDGGISVYTTLNVQHWESLNDVVAQITGIVVRETVPDTFLEQGQDIELVDISPEDLLKRLKEGKVYLGPQAQQALEHFFQAGNLIALRELALRHTAERVDVQVQAYKADRSIGISWPVAERLLVGVTASPMSARLVRAAQRLAARLRCEWIAVNVETPESARMPAKDRERLLQTLRLAEELGAETAALSGDEASATLVDYARSRNVTKIVVGKPRQAFWREKLFGSVVNRMAHLCGDIDLYVISGVGGEFASRRPVQGPIRTPWSSWLRALLTVAAGTLLGWLLFPKVDRANIIMIYLLGVMWAAYRLGRAPALATAVLSVFCFDFFFVPPYYTLSVSDTQYLITFAVMLAAGLLISTIAGRMRAQTKATLGREARTRALYRLSRELSETPQSRVLVTKAWRRLEEFYRVPVLLLLPDEGGALSPAEGSPEKFGFDEKEAAVAKWVFDHGQEAGSGTNTLAGSRGLYLPLKGLKGAVGVLGIRPGEGVRPEDPDQMRLLETFASEIGAALASTQLSESAGRAEAQVEVERLRNLVLSEFSGNLQEPLSEISSVTSQLLDSYPSLQETLKRGLRDIQEKTSRLGSLAAELPRLIESRAKERHAAGSPAEASAAPALAGAKLRVSDFLSDETVLVFKQAMSKEEAFKELIGKLRLPDAAEALRLIMEREKAGSTVIGSGLAIPHARLAGLAAIQAALGVAPKGIEGGIQVVMLFIGPAERFRDHLAFLAAVSALFRSEGLIPRIVAAGSPAEIAKRIREAELPAE